MKKYLFVGFVVAAAFVSTAGAQSFSTSNGNKKTEPVRRPPPVTRAPNNIGAAVRAFRGGNPIQMINPKAPAQYYAPPQETVVYDPYNPSKITGIIFFGLRW